MYSPKSKRDNTILVGKKLADKLNLKLKSKVVITFQDENYELTSLLYRVEGIFRSGNSRYDETNVFVRNQSITKNLPDEWYNTPNLHMCTIKDFFNFCYNKKIEIYKSIALNGEKTSKIQKKNLNLKNINSEVGIFLIKK